MTNIDIIKKALQYNKAAFENIYTSVSAVQEENRKVAGDVISKAAFLPEEGKAAAQKWLQVSREAGEKFREDVLKGHEQIEKYIEAA